MSNLRKILKRMNALNLQQLRVVHTFANTLLWSQEGPPPEWMINTDEYMQAKPKVKRAAAEILMRGKSEHKKLTKRLAKSGVGVVRLKVGKRLKPSDIVGYPTKRKGSK